MKQTLFISARDVCKGKGYHRHVIIYLLFSKFFTFFSSNSFHIPIFNIRILIFSILKLDISIFLHNFLDFFQYTKFFLEILRICLNSKIDNILKKEDMGQANDGDCIIFSFSGN